MLQDVPGSTCNCLLSTFETRASPTNVTLPPCHPCDVPALSPCLLAVPAMLSLGDRWLRQLLGYRRTAMGSTDIRPAMQHPSRRQHLLTQQQQLGGSCHLAGQWLSRLSLVGTTTCTSSHRMTRTCRCTATDGCLSARGEAAPLQAIWLSGWTAVHLTLPSGWAGCWGMRGVCWHGMCLIRTQ